MSFPSVDGPHTLIDSEVTEGYFARFALAGHVNHPIKKRRKETEESRRRENKKPKRGRGGEKPISRALTQGRKRLRRMYLERRRRENSTTTYGPGQRG